MRKANGSSGSGGSVKSTYGRNANVRESKAKKWT